MPRIKKQKKLLKAIGKVGGERTRIRIGHEMDCRAQLKVLEEQGRNGTLLKRLRRYIRSDNLCTWDLGICVRTNKKRCTEPNIKRLTPSQMYQISAGERKIKYLAIRNGEKDIRERWVEYFSLSSENFAEEVVICRPDYPLICGIMDGLIKINSQIFIVEFKGILDQIPRVITGEFRDNSPEIQQCLVYSFLNNWKDVLLVYGLKNKKNKIFTTSFNFSITKPFKRYLEEAMEDDFLDYFTKNILIWKLLNDNRQHLRVFNQERIKKNVDNIVEIVKKFQKDQKKQKSLKYPKLKNIRREREWEIIHN